MLQKVIDSEKAIFAKSGRTGKTPDIGKAFAAS